MFEIGEKVVCVDDEWGGSNVPGPKKGKVYTVKERFRSIRHEHERCPIYIRVDESDFLYSALCFKRLPRRDISQSLAELKALTTKPKAPTRELVDV